MLTIATGYKGLLLLCLLLGEIRCCSVLTSNNPVLRIEFILNLRKLIYGDEISLIKWNLYSTVQICAAKYVRHKCSNDLWSSDLGKQWKYEMRTQISYVLGHWTVELRKNFLNLRPPLWSSGQSSWLQIRRPGFDSRKSWQSLRRQVAVARSV
jgi:hypothetical protein